MTAVLDTNVLVRHLVRDDEEQAERATGMLGHEGEELLLASVVLAEVIFVLESIYGQPRGDITVAVLALLALPAVVAPEARTLIEALRIYQSHRVHFVDAYVSALARTSGIARVMSFDRQLDRIDGIERVEP